MSFDYKKGMRRTIYDVDTQAAPPTPAARLPAKLPRLLSAPSPNKLDGLGLALVLAIWGAGLFLLGALVITITLDHVDVAGILNPPPPTLHAPLVAATPPAAPLGRVLLVLPAQGAPAK